MRVCHMTQCSGCTRVCVLMPCTWVCVCSCHAHTEANEFDGNRAGRHFALPVGHGAGKPYPLGPSLVTTTLSNNTQDVRCTMNFAVRGTGKLKCAAFCMLVLPLEWIGRRSSLAITLGHDSAYAVVF
jgi:hypothetical protein